MSEVLVGIEFALISMVGWVFGWTMGRWHIKRTGCPRCEKLAKETQ